MDPTYLRRGRGRLGPLVPTSGVRVALVSTLRDVRDQLLLWIEFYRVVGFAHLFLYFDDPAKDEDSIEEALEVYSVEFLSIACNGSELRAEWPTLRSWSQFSDFVDDRMCRQLLNIAHCVRRGLQAPRESLESVDWVIHLDHDELFLPPPGGLQAHFKHLDDSGCRLFLYQNFEAVPEEHTLLPFLDVTLFKVPQGRVPRTPMGASGVEFWASRTQAGNYFLYYDNGKSAVRLRRPEKDTEFAPRSVHLLYPEDEMSALESDRAAWTNFAEHELESLQLQWMVSQADEITVAAKVLHYPATHFERLFRKYDHLKNFPAVRFGGGLVVPPSFHLEARDCYVAHLQEGKEVQLQKLKELLENVAMLRDIADVSKQLQIGTIVRVGSVGDIFKHGQWIPPKSFAEGLSQRMRRWPPPEEMQQIRGMPRADAALLYDGVGQNTLLGVGLQESLSAIALCLETKGWAACVLGAHPGLLTKARAEAKMLEARMAPGTTVIKNQVIDQRLPNAQRGDKILWMQEQGLDERGSGGPPAACDGGGRSGGPLGAPTLAMLERAIADIGFQLDPLLQQSSLRLRITERCDGMLACYSGEGASYGPHIDNADGDGRVDGRVLTAILYLNPGWDRTSGGELSIFEAETGELGSASVEGRWQNVWPEMGTLALFRADRTLHEVRPSHARRYALSVWFCGQDVRYGGDGAG